METDYQNTDGVDEGSFCLARLMRKQAINAGYTSFGGSHSDRVEAPQVPFGKLEKYV